MKKRFLFLPFLAAMMFAGCSNDELVVDNGQELSTGEDRYLSVSIVTTEGTNTRAADFGATSTGDPNNATYEKGYANENTVKSVCFYFFDSEGNAAAVKADGSNSYKPLSLEYDNDNMPTIENKIKAMIVISTPEGDKIPSKIVAVVNPPENGFSAATLDQLRANTADYVANAKGIDGFIMMNSVYVNGDGEAVYATDVKSDNLKETESEAKNNPVSIYVERNVAKVRMHNELQEDMSNQGYYKLQTKKQENGEDVIKDLVIKDKGKDIQVYMKFNGWNITADAEEGYLGKHLGETWTNSGENAPFANWNWAPYYRSFWALNPQTTNRYGNFNEAASNLNFDNVEITLSDNIKQQGNIEYCNENAEKSGTLNNTKVIIAATLYKLVAEESGTQKMEPLTLVEHNGVRMVDDPETLDGLKNSILEMLDIQRLSYYKNVTVTEGESTQTKKVKIDVDDIKLVTAKADGQADDKEYGDNGERCYVYAVPVNEKETWYESDSESAQKRTDLVANLIKYGKAMVWNAGMTYYYTEIKHLHGQPGVVRNHIYDITLKSVYGLGTPVYDSSEKIYPEKPNSEETYIAAEINIIPWRVVKNDVTLDW